MLRLMLSRIPISLKRSLDLTTRIMAPRDDCLNGIIGFWLKSDEKRTCLRLNSHVLQKSPRSQLFKYIENDQRMNDNPRMFIMLKFRQRLRKLEAIFR